MIGQLDLRFENTDFNACIEKNILFIDTINDSRPSMHMSVYYGAYDLSVLIFPHYFGRSVKSGMCIEQQQMMHIYPNDGHGLGCDYKNKKEEVWYQKKVCLTSNQMMCIICLRFKPFIVLWVLLVLGFTFNYWSEITD